MQLCDVQGCAACTALHVWCKTIADVLVLATGPQSRRETEKAELRDPYEPLDPHAPGDLPLRPFRKSKPRRCTALFVFRRPGHIATATEVA